MTYGSQFVGIRLRNLALRTGLFTGLAISAILVTWLLVANRVVALQAYGTLRNACAGILTALFMAIPVLRFRRQPVTMFVAGLTAWLLLTLTYLIAELNFSLLESRMGAFHLFMMGSICYGFLAVLAWVFALCVQTRHRYASRQDLPAVERQRRSS